MGGSARALRVARMGPHFGNLIGVGRAVPNVRKQRRPIDNFVRDICESPPADLLQRGASWRTIFRTDARITGGRAITASG